MFEYIYLLQTRESITNNEQVYKVGRTYQDELKRFNNYPKGSQLHLHISCLNSVEVERSIITDFNNLFQNVELYGKEYFKGNLLDMMKVILNNISLSFDCLSSNYHYCQKLQSSINANSELQCKIKDISSTVDTLVLQNKKLMADNQLLQSGGGDEGNEGGITANNHIAMDNDKIDLKCSKCNNFFYRKDYLKKHEEKCDGLDSKQCKICLKFFTTQQGKWKHMKYVKCSPPPSTS